MEIALRSLEPEDTRAIGGALAELLEAGDAVILTGELGAGKTTLVQGVAEGLGVRDHVTSPTFVLIHEYEGRLPVAHVDVYRLERLQDVIDLDLDGEGRVLLVEWGDAVREVLPQDHLRVELTTSGADEERRIGIGARGPSWRARWERLEHLMGRWTEAA